MSFQFRRRPNAGNDNNNPRDPYFEQNHVYQDMGPQGPQMHTYEADSRYNHQPSAPYNQHNHHLHNSTQQYSNNPAPFLQNRSSDSYNNPQFNQQFFQNPDFTNHAQSFLQPNFTENQQQNLPPYGHTFQTNHINREYVHNGYNYSQPSAANNRFIKSQELQQRNISSSPTGFETQEIYQSSPIKLLVTVGGVVIIAALSWFAYKWVKSPVSDSPILIHADDTPHKVRPDHKGGINIPYQDKLIYNRISDDTQPTERILPPDEAYQAEEYSQEILTDQQEDNLNNEMQNDNNQDTQPQYQNFHYPSQNQHQQYASNNAPHPQASYDTRQTDNTPVLPRQINESNIESTSEKNIEKPTGSKGSFFIQLATVKSESAAIKEWNRLKNKFGLQKQKSQIKEFKTADGETFYRVLIGPFEDKIKALKQAVKIDGGKLIQIA